METRQTAEAFSSHRSPEVYDRLADNVRWVLPGQAPTQGRAAVIAACEAAASECAQLAGTDTVRFLSVADDGTAAVDATTRYRSPDGSASVVSSADIYEFDQRGLLITITSYAVELDQQS